MVMRRLIQGAGSAVAMIFMSGAAWAQTQDLLGQPVPGGVGLQQAGSQVYREAIGFHNYILMPIITVICLFVLALLLIVIFKFNRRANPTPSRVTHNTALEVVWTTVPVLILMFIAIFSFRLLYRYHDMPPPELTVKVTGNQWYWSYEYPDHGEYGFDSRMLTEDEANSAGVPYRLAATNPMVVPAGRTVRLLITASDVIHAVGVPSLGVKMDAIPGRINEAWFHADRPGIYYGQCYELCGVDHAFMPVQINALAPEEFDAWLAANAPAPPPEAAPEVAAATATPEDAELPADPDTPLSAPAAPEAAPAV